MILELLFGYWALKPLADDIDQFSYEHELMQNEIEDLKREIRILKSSQKQYEDKY